MHETTLTADQHTFGCYFSIHQVEHNDVKCVRVHEQLMSVVINKLSSKVPRSKSHSDFCTFRD